MMSPDFLSIGLGSIAIAFGIYTFYIRKNNPDKFVKLRSMKKFYGEKAGETIHIITYTVAPLVIGFLLIVKGLFQ